METRQPRGGWIAALRTPASGRAWNAATKSSNGSACSSCRNSLADNLHNRGNNQSDASFGLTAAIAEPLLQSHAGEISLLPALPPGWSSGSVKGLRARGDFEVDITWHDGKLVEAAIRSLNGGSAKLRYGPVTREVKLAKGETYRWNGQ